MTTIKPHNRVFGQLMKDTVDNDTSPRALARKLIDLDAHPRVHPHPLDLPAKQRKAVKMVLSKSKMDGHYIRPVVFDTCQATKPALGKNGINFCSCHLMNNHRCSQRGRRTSCRTGRSVPGISSPSLRCRWRVSTSHAKCVTCLLLPSIAVTRGPGCRSNLLSA